MWKFINKYSRSIFEINIQILGDYINLYCTVSGLIELCIIGIGLFVGLRFVSAAEIKIIIMYVISGFILFLIFGLFKNF